MNTAHRHRLAVTFFACLGLSSLGLILAPDANGPAPRIDATPPAPTGSSTSSTTGLDATPREMALRQCYDLHPGERLQLGMNLQLRGSLRQGDSAPQQLRMGITGDLELLVLARRDDQLALRVTMPAATVSSGAEASDPAIRGLRDALNLGTVVQLSSRGSILGYRFPTVMSPAQRNQFRTLFAALRGPLGDPAQTRWQTIDADATGDAEVAGEWDAARLVVTWHKTAYHRGALPFAPEVDGHDTATLDPRAAWWSVLDGEEASAVRLSEASLVIEATATMHARLLTADTVAIAGLDAFDWHAPWAPANGASEHDSDAVDPESARLAQELRGVTIAVEVARLRELLAAAAGDEELYAARRRLIWLLRNDPQAMRQLEALLAAADVPPQLVSELLSAAGAADTAATQAFLLRQLDGDHSPAVRLMSMQSLFQGTAAVGPAVAAIRNTLAADASDELQGTGLLLLGALASRHDGGGALSELLDRQSFAREHGLVVDWLEALGNAGRPEVVDAALPSFAAEGEQERAAAIAALRKVDDPRVHDLLLDHAEHDAAPLVRTRAIEGLAARTGDDIVPMLDRVLATDQDDSVRNAAMLLLAQRADRNTAELVLVRVAGQDRSARLRELATDLLAQLRG